jgi:hypothetical protein
MRTASFISASAFGMSRSPVEHSARLLRAAASARKRAISASYSATHDG